MWSGLLEWVKALGLGSLVGVFVGAGLTRRAQDRQFARQQAAQRLDRARSAYQQAEATGYKLLALLNPWKGQVIGPRNVDRVSSVVALSDEVLDAEVKLQSEGASEVIEALSRIWTTALQMHARIAATAEYITYAEQVETQELDWHRAKAVEMHDALVQAQERWVSWQLAQESMHERKRRIWIPQRDRARKLPKSDVTGG